MKLESTTKERFQMPFHHVSGARLIAVAALLCAALCAAGCNPATSAVPSADPESERNLQDALSEARSHSDAEDYTSAEARLLEVIAGAKGVDPRLSAEAHTLLSQVQLQLKKHQDAADAAREAIALYRKAGLDESEGMVRALSNLGHGLAVTSQEEARQMLMQAKALAEQIKLQAPLVRVGIEDGLADVLVRQGNMEAAEPYYQGALKILMEERPDEEALMIQALTNLGAYYQYVGELDRSEDYFNRARTVIEKSPKPDEAALVRVLSGEAFIKYRRGECDAAVSLLQAALEGRTADAQAADASIAKVHHDLGAAYECAGNRNAALDQYRASLEMLTALNDPAAAHVQQRLQALEAEDFSPAPSEPADPAPPES
jgi:tetratricopeptide (TPR) repeat protein